ncbi:ISAs1 family transposase, partial [Escherichia coli]|nr:ISAs1 family transposase [Escherichia coli]EFJ3399464.1 ISAs1 family transposase [Escherichia coli]EFN5254519.1 ISAs1 family transposase [Escherichia coli]EFN5669246.1 ISAs1 family transposase [Escherichia coli]EGQ2028722.1 ISAs1 family transposase [Escherichia coli]
FGRYELTTAYTPAGQLQSQHLNSLLSDRDYTWNDNGELIRISSPRQTRSYSYSTTGRLTGVHTTAANLDIRIPYATDPAGNRLPDPELHPDSTLSMWPDNRIARDAHYLYRYDRYGRLTEKTDLIPEGGIRTDDERTHRYHYDSQHRLVHYTRTQYAEPLVESRYLYDPLGRRVAKRVWRRERDLTGWMSLSRKPQVTWYGWDGDRLTTIQNDRTRIQTIYQPGSFTPLIRVETATGEQAKTQRRSLADISPAKFHECFINWMRDCHSSNDKDVIAIDGKTLRHSYDKSRRRGAIHVISAFSTMHSLVIGQIKTDKKSNEITAIPELLNMLDIKGKIITTDAMGCQKDIAEKIQKQGGDYLFAVKGNQGRLNKAFEEKFPLKELNNPKHDSYAISEKSHGREETRLHIVCDVPDELIDFTFE